ncbi:hypothetical protein HUU42_09510 [bacterium]|nr:hypothetical protein [bacterium]
MNEAFKCTQCFSVDGTAESNDKIRCNYCHTLFKIVPETPVNPKVIIAKGANVVFGKNSNVTIKGGVKIEDGANVQFLGKLEILEVGDKALIEQIKNRAK